MMRINKYQQVPTTSTAQNGIRTLLPKTMTMLSLYLKISEQFPHIKPIFNPEQKTQNQKTIFLHPLNLTNLLLPLLHSTCFVNFLSIIIYHKKTHRFSFSSQFIHSPQSSSTLLNAYDQISAVCH